MKWSRSKQNIYIWWITYMKCMFFWALCINKQKQIIYLQSWSICWILKSHFCSANLRFHDNINWICWCAVKSVCYQMASLLVCLKVCLPSSSCHSSPSPPGQTTIIGFCRRWGIERLLRASLTRVSELSCMWGREEEAVRGKILQWRRTGKIRDE